MTSSAPDGRAVAAAALIAVLAVLLLYSDTVRSLISIWERSGTFAHCFVVVPISVWLIWRERRQLARLEARTFPPALIAIALAGVAWLLAELATVNSVKQFALIVMIQATVVAVVGRRIGRALAFPLAFLLFAAPAGEFLVPALMNWTADFTTFALKLSGIPVYREGNTLVIPTGTWSVVEACSGVRYLIAAFMAGTLFAYLHYQSTRKRLLFMAASIVVPLVANWLRAYLIVLIGHLSENKLAAGVDHLIYGWLFFGIVIGMMYWIGLFWQDPEAELPAVQRGSSHGPTGEQRRLLWRSAAVAIAAVAMAGLWLPVADALNRPSERQAPVLSRISAPLDWKEEASQFTDWKPRILTPKAELVQAFSKGDAHVGLNIEYYMNQSRDSEVVNSENVLVSSTDPEWRLVSSGTETMNWGGKSVTVRFAVLHGKRTTLLVKQFYWINGHLTSNDYLAKLLLALFKIAGGRDDSAMIVIYAPVSESGQTADAMLDGFAATVAGPIDLALNRARDR